MSTSAARTFDLKPEPPGHNFFALVRALGAGGGKIGAVRRAIDEGAVRVPPAVERIVKSAVGAASVESLLSAPGDGAIITSGFYASLRSQSIFFRMLDSGMARVPYNAPVGVQTGTLTAAKIDEGKSTPVSTIGLDKPRLTPIKCGAMTVATRELLEVTNGAMGDLLANEIKAATVKVVDELMLAEIAGDIEAAPETPGGMAGDLQAALSFMSQTGAERLLWAASPDIAVALTINMASGGASVMTPSGGTVHGVPLVVSTALAPASLLLLDASAFMGNTGGLELRVSDSADVVMDSAPAMASDTPTGAASLVSMFQSNSVAIRTRIDFAIKAIRQPAGFLMSPVDWSSPAT